MMVHMKNMMNKPKKLLTIICFCLRMALNPLSKDSRKYFLLNIFFSVTSAALPFMMIYISSLIIEPLASSILAVEADSETIRYFLMLCAAILIIGLCSKIIDKFKFYCDGMYREILSNHIKVLMMEKSANLDVCFFDSPVF